MSAKRTFFGTDGIRGPAGQWPLNSRGCLSLGRALATFLGHGSVVVGRDSRQSGAALQLALMSGLIEGGLTVVDVGIAPTPALAYLAKNGHQAGVVLTASHNPYQDNGIKIFNGQGQKLTDDDESKLELLLTEKKTDNRFPPLYGELMRGEEALQQYADATLLAGTGSIDLKGLKIVLDCAHGAAFQLAPALLKRAGAQLTVRGVTPDGKNINCGVGALHPESLRTAILKSGADLGVALDGDGDRLILLDAQGQIVNGDAIMAMLALHQKKLGTLTDPRIVMTSMSNLGVEGYLRSKGIELLRADVGDRYVLKMLKEQGLHLGGEQSGHIIDLQHSTTGDGLLTALTVASIMVKENRPLHTFVGDIPVYPQVLLNTPVENRVPIENLPDVVAAIKKAESQLGNSGRVVVRYSGTEFLARVMIEGPTQPVIVELAEGIIQAFSASSGV